MSREPLVFLRHLILLKGVPHLGGLSSLALGLDFYTLLTLPDGRFGRGIPLPSRPNLRTTVRRPLHK